MTVLRILSESEPTWVRAYDPNAKDGRGDVILTRNRAHALHFDSMGEAFTYWRQQSTIRPLRTDGKPNRPLTAYSVTFEPDDAHERTH